MILNGAKLMLRVAFSVVVLVSTFGCAHLQLKRNFTKQTSTLADLYEEQVLDNIAAFVANAGTTPSFALPSGGGTTINHSNTGTAGFNWNSKAFTGASGGLNGSRSLTENWSLQPITNPDRLRLMKCVFQYVTCCESGSQCQDCDVILQRFFGETYLDCTLPQCFFDVSNDRPQLFGDLEKTGFADGVYVTVLPCHYEPLSRVTLAILDIATVSDVELAKRIAAPKEGKVNLTETFIAEFDGKPRLIQGQVSLTESQYKELQGKAIRPNQAFLDALNTPTTDSNLGSEGALESFEFEAQDNRFFSPSPRQQILPNFESLLQMNQAQSFGNQ